MPVIGSDRKWDSKSKLTKRILSSPSGLSYETTTPAKGAVGSSKKTKPKASTVHISKPGRTKTQGTTLSTSMQSVQDVIHYSTVSQKSTGHGKFPKKAKRSLSVWTWQATPIRKKIGFQKLFTGSKSLITKPIFSTANLFLAIVLYLLIKFLAHHLEWK